jgi:hypothetical protein
MSTNEEAIRSINLILRRRNLPRLVRLSLGHARKYFRSFRNNQNLTSNGPSNSNSNNVRANTLAGMHPTLRRLFGVPERSTRRTATRRG